MAASPLAYLGASAATTSAQGVVELATVAETTTGTNTTKACTPAGVAAVAIAGATDASTTTKGIIEIATNTEAANGSSGVLALVPSNVASIMAAPGAIGATTAAAGTFKALTADGTGTVSLTGNAASTLTNTSGDLTVDAQAGSLVLDSGEATDDAVRMVASNAAGGIDMDAGTGGITIDSTDTVSIDAAAASNFTTSAGDLSLISSAGSLNLTGSQDAADAVVITSAAGGIDILATGEAGQDIDMINTGGSVNITATEDAAQAIYIRANGGTSETVDIHADQGTGVASINMHSDVGGVTIASGLGSADAININASNAAGGIDIDAGTAGVIVDTTGAISLDAAAASNFTATGAFDVSIISTAGSVNVTAGEADAAAVAIQCAAGGVDIDGALSVDIASSQAAATAIQMDASNGAGGITMAAGTGGILMGNQADCTTIDIGDFAPTASRTVTIGGGTVVTASVTDLIDIAPDGATTNADSIKQVDVLTGTVATGQCLLNLASGAITSGTHTVSIQTGNAAAGTVATNISTGTGSKTVNIGNSDSGTTMNLDGAVAINNNVNAAVTINDGTSTGAITMGNSAAGAIAIDSGAGISIDAATASNFACAAGDMTIDATTGSLILAANEDVEDCISLIADNGGINITCSSASAGQDIDINTDASVNIIATESDSAAIVINASGAAGAVQINAGTGSVRFGSGLVVPVTAVDNGDTPYTVLGTDYFLSVDTSAGVVTVTLPAATGLSGRTYLIKDMGGSAGANNITIGGGGTNLVGGGAAAASKTISTNYAGARVTSNGTIWCYEYIA